MSNDVTFGQITRTINSSIKLAGMPYKGKFSAVGSFFALRIEDADGVVTVKQLDEIVRIAEYTMSRVGVKHARRVASGYHNAGCVVNWDRN